MHKKFLRTSILIATISLWPLATITLCSAMEYMDKEELRQILIKGPCNSEKQPWTLDYGHNLKPGAERIHTYQEKYYGDKNHTTFPCPWCKAKELYDKK